MGGCLIQNNIIKREIMYDSVIVYFKVEIQVDWYFDITNLFYKSFLLGIFLEKD